jgi:mannitol-1-phosphate 5-dehydrogenase
MPRRATVVSGSAHPIFLKEILVMSARVFVGFGLGPIQAGLFLAEAWHTGQFERLVVAEVNPVLVDQVRAAGGYFYVNIAEQAGVRTEKIGPIEIFNPTVPADAEQIIAALAAACEAATALPSVAFFSRGTPSVADLFARAAELKIRNHGPACIIYTGENNNHAAEELQAAISERLPAELKTQAFCPAPGACLQVLNTVIGKMSGIHDGEVVTKHNLVPMTSGNPRACLVEAFSRILISRVELPGFTRTITVFEEKQDLLPFEEAKLYGHNAIHALLGYLSQQRGHALMSDLSADPELLAFGRAAFLDESGKGLIKRHAGIDPLFTAAGWQAYADDLLERMANPWLLDAVDRVCRDPLRKLAWEDRLIGAMRVALQAGVQPTHLALGVRAALDFGFPGETLENQLTALRANWPEFIPTAEAAALLDLIRSTITSAALPAYTA